jgi:hypothetical protein
MDLPNTEASEEWSIPRCGTLLSKGSSPFAFEATDSIGEKPAPALINGQGLF